MRPLHPSTEVGRIFFLFVPYGTDEYGRIEDKERNHLFIYAEEDKHHEKCLEEANEERLFG